jgi:hypothetical protein
MKVSSGINQDHQQQSVTESEVRGVDRSKKAYTYDLS